MTQITPATTQSPSVAPLRIAACGVVSPAGYGLGELAEALHGGRAACADPGEIPGDERLPEPVRAVPGLRAADHLGRKGTRFLDRTSTLGLVAGKMALESMASPADESDGVVMGTSTGSVRSSSEFARDTFVEDRPYLVNPGLFPNTVMNSCAGQIAIWNALRGVNATFSGGQLSSLQAVRYARNALERQQVGRLITGGVEELSPQTAWAWRRSGALPDGAPVGEGCAVFVLERADGSDGSDGSDGTDGDLAVELLACDIAYAPAPDRRPRLLDALTNSIERAILRSRVDPDAVTLASLSAVGGGGEQHIEERAIRRVLDRLPGMIRVKDVVGECYSASGALQLAAAMAHWNATGGTGEGRPGDGPGDVALITSVGRDGNVGCLVARRCPAA